MTGGTLKCKAWVWQSSVMYTLQAKHMGYRMEHSALWCGAVFLLQGMAWTLYTGLFCECTEFYPWGPSGFEYRFFRLRYWVKIGNCCLWRKSRWLVIPSRWWRLRYGIDPTRLTWNESMAIPLAVNWVCDGWRIYQLYVSCPGCKWSVWLWRENRIRNP